MWGKMQPNMGKLSGILLALAVCAAQGWAGDVFGGSVGRHLRQTTGMHVLRSQDQDALPPEVSSSGLLTQTHFLMQSYQGPIDDRTIIVGDAFAGQSIVIGHRDLGFHFGGGVHGSLEALRFGASGQEQFYLGLGAIGGAQYYVSDSVAVFLQLHGVYGLLGLPSWPLLRIEGGMQF